MFRRKRKYPDERILLIVQDGGLVSDTPSYVDVVRIKAGMSWELKTVAPAATAARGD